jgi:hypothetical protein
VKACRLPLALLAALLALPAAAPAAPAPNATCAALVAARAPIELPVRVAPGLTVRVRDPYGGAPVEAELQVTATDCQLATLSPNLAAPGAMTLDVASGGPPLRAIELVQARGSFAVPHSGLLGTATIGGRARPLRASALDRRHRTLRIAGLPAGTASVRVRFARGVAPGSACAMRATLEGGAGPPVRVLPRC